VRLNLRFSFYFCLSFFFFFARVSPIYSACLGSLKIWEVFSGLIKLNVFMLFLIAFFLVGLVFIVLHLIHLSHPVRLFAQVRRDLVTSDYSDAFYPVPWCFHCPSLPACEVLLHDAFAQVFNIECDHQFRCAIPLNVNIGKVEFILSWIF